MDWPIARLAATGSGIQSLPAAPSSAIIVTDAGANNVFGTYVEFLSAAANIKDRLLVGMALATDSTAGFITLSAQIGLGAVSAETVAGVADILVLGKTGAGFIVGSYVNFAVPILVQSGKRIAVRTSADLIGGPAFNHYVKLYYVMAEDLISVGF